MVHVAPVSDSRRSQHRRPVPTTAARLVQPLGVWRRYDAARQALMRASLERVLAAPGLSPNTYEMVSKSLA
jgi:aminopeptidase N